MFFPGYVYLYPFSDLKERNTIAQSNNLYQLSTSQFDLPKGKQFTTEQMKTIRKYLILCNDVNRPIITFQKTAINLVAYGLDME